jgi:putative acetyltransferase
MDIRPGDFDDTRVQALLRLHVEGMHAASPPGTCFVLDLSGLQIPEISFFTAWGGDDLLGMGAIKDLGDGTAEIKSMRTDPRHLHKGVGAFVLAHLLDVARKGGYRRVSLETGTGPTFEAAIALYLRSGFRKGVAFSDYVETEFNQFYHLDLA